MPCPATPKRAKGWNGNKTGPSLAARPQDISREMHSVILGHWKEGEGRGGTSNLASGSRHLDQLGPATGREDETKQCTPRRVSLPYTRIRSPAHTPSYLLHPQLPPYQLTWNPHIPTASPTSQGPGAPQAQAYNGRGLTQSKPYPTPQMPQETPQPPILCQKPGLVVSR